MFKTIHCLSLTLECQLREGRNLVSLFTALSPGPGTQYAFKLFVEIVKGAGGKESFLDKGKRIRALMLTKLLLWAWPIISFVR